MVLFSRLLMLIFVQPQETEIPAIGVQYLRIVGSFYWGIGWLLADVTGLLYYKIKQRQLIVFP